MQQVGLPITVSQFLTFTESGRRRVVLSATSIDGRVKLGFVENKGQMVTDIEECPVMDSSLQAALANIRQFSQSLPLGKKPVRINVLMTSAGLDLSVIGARKPHEKHLQSLIRKSGDLGFARLSWEDEVLIEHRKPALRIGTASVVPPPGSFIQANLEAEHRMAELTLEHLADCKVACDLYCGIGTFALRLAEKCKVSAFEESQSAIEALDRGWRNTGGQLKEIKTEVRNLERRPVLASELKKTDGLVFDPPRAGAELQCKQIARSKVRKIVAVSCNPATLARDLNILVEGGYSVKRLVAIDQFQYTPHVECVALLERTTL